MPSSDQTSNWKWDRWKWSITITALVILVLAIAGGLINKLFHKSDMKCLLDVINNTTVCRPVCIGKEFSLYGMDKCHPWLDCDSITNNVFVTDHIIGGGAVKMIKLGRWKEHDVAVSYLKDDRFIHDFLFNVQMLQLFNTNPNNITDHVVQLIGFCNESHQPLVITEYHFFGSADKVKDILESHLPVYDSLATRFSLCVDFVRILTMLHNHINGTRVFCDANDPEKTLSQFLLSADLRLILNDMDALPVVSEKEGILVKCGSRELGGEYVAPEQIWPYDDIPFNDSMMPGYTEKIDIWKIPDVFNYLLDGISGSNRLKLQFFNIHSKCKNTVADLRPSAGEVLHEYENYLKKSGFSFNQNKMR